MKSWLGLFVFLATDLLAFVAIRRASGASGRSNTEETDFPALPVTRVATDLLLGIALLLLAVLLWKLWRLVS